VTRLSWAHPEFGSVLASSSFDRTVKIWEQTFPDPSVPAAVGSAPPTSDGASRWVERATIADARGTVRGVSFAPHHFGLKLVSITPNPVNT
jgi:nucleoporin SEH1